MFFKTVVLKFRKFHRKAPVSESFLIKLQALRNSILLKRYSCEICEIFRNTFIYCRSPVAASDNFKFPACNFIKKEIPGKNVFMLILQNFYELLLTEHLGMTAC